MPKETDSGLFTIATIREGKEGEEILFNERQQIFTLPPKAKSFAAFAPSFDLKEAVKKKAPVPVKAVLNPKKGIVEKIEPAGAKEADQFHEARTLLEAPAKPMRVTAATLDPITANVVDMEALAADAIKAKATGAAAPSCTAVVPNLAKAQQIFDFCAKQSCNLPGPYGISPCIPFQYVRDGCYARAHKMRWILLSKYGYCCQKIFSFANKGNDKLAVKADKWGGCCVTWWYHVAPLIYVNFPIPVVGNMPFAMVIDPGMFNGPVLMSAWLAAQQTTACYAGAHVSSYSLQPDTAYAPANYAGTAFTTDPNYTQTNATLTAYKNLKTC